MKTAIILHGRPDKEEYFDSSQPSPANAHWLPWLKGELTKRGIPTEVPELPKPYEPDYESWRATFEQFPIDNEAILVGHSRGGAFLVRWLSENKIDVGVVALVAPSLTPNPETCTGFSDFPIDKGIIDRAAALHIFYSLDDEEGILESVEMLHKALPDAHYHEFSDKGHFTLEDMGTTEFPELLRELLKK